MSLTPEQTKIALTTIKPLARKFVFPPFELEDVIQHAYLELLKTIHNYDPKQDFQKFVFIHTKNRLINLKRDKFKRPNCPCQSCHNSIDGETAHEDGRYCQPYNAWLKDLMRKQSLRNKSMDFDTIPPRLICGEDTTLNNAIHNELLEKIDKIIPDELRDDYLRMRSNIPISSAKKKKIAELVRQVYNEED